MTTSALVPVCSKGNRAALAVVAGLMLACCTGSDGAYQDGIEEAVDGGTRSSPDDGPDDSIHADGDGDGDADGDGDSDGDGDGDVDGDAGAMEEEELPPPDPEEEEDPEAECDTENEVVLYLSADDSNSMAGPALAEGLISRGRQIRFPIRIYEFLNYYNFDYEPADEGTVRVSAQMRPNDDGETFNLQVGVRAPDQTDDNRRPLNITLSLDTSGSMSGQPIEHLRDSCLALASSLRGGDIISMVTWSTGQNTLLNSHVVDGPDDPTLTQECEDVRANGGTNLHAGLVAAYDLAEANFSPDRINRVILMSDGGANVGITDETLIAEYADDAEGEAIYLMGVGLGDGPGYNDLLMDTVTDAGKGAYVFVHSREEAERMFGDQFLTNVEVAARDVRVELTMPPTFRMVEFHGEEVSEVADEVEPQHLAPNDAMIYHQVIGSCDPDAVTMDQEVTIRASFSDPFTREPEVVTAQMTMGELLTGDDRLLIKGDAVVAYAQALEETRHTHSAGEATEIVETALAQVQAANDALGGDPDLEEIAQLLAAYRSVVSY